MVATTSIVDTLQVPKDGLAGHLIEDCGPG